MNIKQKDFNKLKQLDRIEYRQKEDRINEWNNLSWGNVFLSSLIYVTLFFLIYLPLMKLVGLSHSVLIDIWYRLLLVLKLMAFLSLGGFVRDFFNYSKRMKMLKELKEEYFGVEIKK